MRSHFTNGEGLVDWQGRTFAYREAVSETYRLGHYTKDEQSRVAGTIRYHIGNALRDRLSEDELAEAGLLPVSPKQRGEARRGRDSALLNAYRRGTEGNDDPATSLEPLRAIAAACALLIRVNPDLFSEASERDRAAAKKLLTELVRVAERILASL
jgi:hypothetical protein